MHNYLTSSQFWRVRGTEFYEQVLTSKYTKIKFFIVKQFVYWDFWVKTSIQENLTNRIVCAIVSKLKNSHMRYQSNMIVEYQYCSKKST